MQDNPGTFPEPGAGDVCFGPKPLEKGALDDKQPELLDKKRSRPSPGKNRSAIGQVHNANKINDLAPKPLSPLEKLGGDVHFKQLGFLGFIPKNFTDKPRPAIGHGGWDYDFAPRKRSGGRSEHCRGRKRFSFSLEGKNMVRHGSFEVLTPLHGVSLRPHFRWQKDRIRNLGRVSVYRKRTLPFAGPHPGR